MIRPHHPMGEDRDDDPGSAAASLALRPADLTDADAIFELIDATSKTTTVLPRSRISVTLGIRDFVVALEGEKLLGCGALLIVSRGLAEIRSLAVAPEARGRGLGSTMVQALLDEARRLRLERVFALTDNADFFVRNGLRLADKETLPEKVWNDCVHCPIFDNCTEVPVELVLGTGVADPGEGD